MRSLNVASMFLKVLLQCYPRAHRFQSALLYSQACSLEYGGFSRAHQYRCSRLLTLRCRQKLVEKRVFIVAMHQWATAYELTFSVRSPLSCRLRKLSTPSRGGGPLPPHGLRPFKPCAFNAILNSQSHNTLLLVG